MPYGPPPPEHYTNFSHPFGPHYGAQSRYDNVSSSATTDQAWNEEIADARVPPYHPIQYNYMQPEQHPHFDNSLSPLYGDQHGAQSRYDNVSSSATTDHAWNKEVSDARVPPYHPIQYNYMQPEQHPHFDNSLSPLYGDQPQTPPAPLDTDAVQTVLCDNNVPKQHF
jgi:hypothetical protein